MAGRGARSGAALTVTTATREGAQGAVQQGQCADARAPQMDVELLV